MARQNKHKASGNLRIIGGQWRGRKLTICDAEGLRPTPDRIRETLFNWLQTSIGGARCLDLYAGSGALGLEAASRGAQQVVLVERNTETASQLRIHCQQLDTTQCTVETQAATTFLMTNQAQFDLVFIDPPYQDGAWTEVAIQLTESNALAEQAQIYLEYPSQQSQPTLPTSWQLLKEKTAGAVNYCLFQYSSEPNA